MKHKILYLTLVPVDDGSTRCLLNLLKKLNRDKYEPIVVFPWKGWLTDRCKELGIDVYYLPVGGMKRDLNFTSILKYLIEFWVSTVRIYLLCRKKKISMIHTNSAGILTGGMVSSLLGIPHIWHIREIISSPRILAGILGRVIQLMSTKTIVVSEAIKDNLFGSNTKSEKIYVIYDGAEPERLELDHSGNNLRKELGIPLDFPLVGTVGRFVEWKGQRQFIEASAIVVKQIPNVKFLIVGGITYKENIPYRDSLYKLIDELGLKDTVIMAGKREDVPRVMAALDLFVSPNSEPEPFGLTLLEAMAQCKPILAISMGGPKEIILDRITGKLIPSNNPELMAESIIEILKDRETAGKMGEKGRERAIGYFNFDNNFPKIEKIYSSLLN